MSTSVEAALYQAKNELRSLYDGTSEGILAVDVESRRFVRANRAICELLGYSQEELLLLSVPDLHPPEDLPDVLEAFEAMRQQRLQFVHNIPCLRKDGLIIHVDISAYSLNGHDQTLMFGFFRNISGRRRTEQALRESENTLHNLLEYLPDLVVMVDRNAVIQFANRGISHVEREKLIGACSFSFIAPEHQQSCRDAVERAFATGRPQSVEAQDVFGNWWSCRLVSLVKEGDGEHALIIGTDITEQRLAAEAVDKEQRLLRRLLDLQERDRRLTAYDIHDGFAQQLTGAMFRLQGFREMLDCSPEKAWDDFNSALRLIGRGIDETRRLISGLRPPILDESGVIDAIDYLVCEQGRQAGPTIEFVHNVAFDRLAPPLESALFRITQESLQNACRHSHTDKVRIDLTQCENRIHLDIRDWGVGFSPDGVELHRFGLQGIRERARLLDGCVTIESALGRGTHIAVELPLVDSEGDTTGSD